MRSTDILTDAFGRLPELAAAAVAGLETDGLGYRPDADANSIGWLVWHSARVQDHHVSQLADRTQAYIEDRWADRLGMAAEPEDLGYGHTSRQVGAVRIVARHAARLPRSGAPTHARVRCFRRRSRAVTHRRHPVDSCGDRRRSIGQCDR